jgi:hypothetical protein
MPRSAIQQTPCFLLVESSLFCGGKRYYVEFWGLDFAPPQKKRSFAIAGFDKETI